MSRQNPTAQGHGLLFGPNASGKTYVAMFYHRGTRNPNKTVWLTAFTPSDEYALFNTCDAAGWYSGVGDLWGIANNGRTRFGVDGERLSFCPRNGSAGVPWHGYPVSARSRGYEVPEDVLGDWEKKGVVDGITARRIRGGKI